MFSTSLPLSIICPLTVSMGTLAIHSAIISCVCACWPPPNITTVLCVYMYVTIHCKIIVHVFVCIRVHCNVILVTVDHTGTLTDLIGSGPNINLVTNFEALVLYTLYLLL